MDRFLAPSGASRSKARRVLKPPPRLTVSAWADEFYYLSPESSAVPGRWVTLPYQREPLDAMGDPYVTSLAIMKSARVGYTRMLLAALGYYMHQDPSTCLVIQPTLEDARGFSKDDLQPMLRDCPVLEAVTQEGDEGAGNTMLQHRYPGGVISLIGANSGTGLRRISRRVIAADEVDAYPVLIGEGDVIKLAQKRSEYYHDRRFFAGSTPLIAGHSRIEEMFLEGDARRYFVPCPHCGHFAPLHFSDVAKGHRMVWNADDGSDAFFACQKNGCVIEEKDKRSMITAGEWRPTKRGLPGHRSYHMWSAMSFSPGAAWALIARECIEAKGNVEKLRVWCNTTIGEPWAERGEAPDWERIYRRRETYAIGTVPEGAAVLVCGVDVQKDRWVYEVVAYNEGKESWSVDAGVIPGDTANEADWAKLDGLLNRSYPTAHGQQMGLHLMAVDSGYQTQMVYAWARQRVWRVIAVKGNTSARVIIGTPTPVDVTYRGQRVTRGCKVWPVGVDLAKAELYGWLRLESAEISGFCHFPEYGEEFFKQLTAEHLISLTMRTGFIKREWQLISPNRENHFLDCRVYARAAAACVGLDRMQPARPRAMIPDSSVRPAAPQRPAAPSKAGWLSGRVGKGSWLRK
jgi:phage terminase large subunit GpA-like protein